MFIYDNIRTKVLTVHQKQLLRRYVVFRMVNIFILVFYITTYFMRQMVASVSEKPAFLSHTPTLVRFIYDAGFH
jgi:hypothetical protein